MIVLNPWPGRTETPTTADEEPRQGVVIHAYPEELRSAVETLRNTNSGVIEGSLKYKARRNQSIIIEVLNLTDWLNSADVTNNMPPNMKPSIENLVPYINGVPLEGITYEAFHYKPGLVPNNDLHQLKFTLTRHENNKETWKKLLTPAFRFTPVPVEVSVGFAGGRFMPTDIMPHAKWQEFSLEIIPQGRFWAGFIIILLALFIFIFLAYKTEIIRDTQAPLRPDGTAPFSLARLQMAFWFFLVISSYFLLWVITGDMDTITESVLTLMGISAGTALGAALIDAGKATTDGTSMKYVLIPPADKDTKNSLLRDIQASQQRIMEKRREFEKLPVTSLVDRENNQKEQEQLDERIRVLERQRNFLLRSRFQNFMCDILADNASITFHRFQIFVWTLVLGVMFIFNVMTDLAMPQFNVTLLALMGISAGTFVGFKVPEQKK